MTERIEARLEAFKAEVTAAMAEQVVGEVRKLVAALAARPPPQVLTKAEACRLLSVSATKLKTMIAARLISTCRVGDSTMIPMSEIRRLAEPSMPALRRSGGRPKGKPHNGREEGSTVRARLRDLPKRG